MILIVENLTDTQRVSNSCGLYGERGVLLCKLHFMVCELTELQYQVVQRTQQCPAVSLEVSDTSCTFSHELQDDYSDEYAFGKLIASSRFIMINLQEGIIYGG